MFQKATLSRNTAPRHFGLPWSATDSVIPQGEGTIEWLHSRLDTTRLNNDNAIQVSSHGKQWRFNPAADVLLRHLSESGPVLMSQFFGRFQGDFEREQMRELLGFLVDAGMIAITPVE
jgi:hypothetical protein